MLDQPPEAPSEPERDSRRLDEVRAWGARMERRAQQAEGQLIELGPLRRQAALWRAGVRYGPAADLFLDRLPADLDLDDVDAVRLACAEITSAVLAARAELAEVRS